MERQRALQGNSPAVRTELVPLRINRNVPYHWEVSRWRNLVGYVGDKAVTLNSEDLRKDDHPRDKVNEETEAEDQDREARLEDQHFEDRQQARFAEDLGVIEAKYGVSHDKSKPVDTLSHQPSTSNPLGPTGPMGLHDKMGKLEGSVRAQVK